MFNPYLIRPLFHKAGNDNNAGATTIGSYSFEAGELTQGDELYIFLSGNSQVSLTSAPLLVNFTDTLTLRQSPYNLGGRGIGLDDVFYFKLCCSPFSTKRIIVTEESWDAASVRNGGTPSLTNTIVLTDYTAAWELDIKHGGVGAGGTLYYAIDICHRKCKV